MKSWDQKKLYKNLSGYKTIHTCTHLMHASHTQSAGVLLTVAGFVIIFLVGSYEQPTFAHAIVGIVLTAILLQQFMSGIL